MRAIFILMLICFSLSSYSQNYDLPPNPKPGKCYVKCCPIDFNYNKKYSGVWSEIDCDLAKAKKQKEDIINSENQSIDTFLEYKKLLRSLGYSVSDTTCIDDEFIKVHNKYLSDQKRSNKKRRKLLDNL